MTTLGVYLLFGTLMLLTFWCMVTSGARKVEPPIPLVPPVRCNGCIYRSES